MPRERASSSTIASVAGSSGALIDTGAFISGCYPLRRESSTAHLPRAAADPFVRRQPLQRDRPAGVEPPRRNADLRTQPELAAIGELGGGVPQHDRTVDAVQESLRNPCILGDDRVGMAIASRYSVSQSSALTGTTMSPNAASTGSPRTSHPACCSAVTNAAGAAKSRSISSVSIAPQMPVRRILASSTTRSAIAGSAEPST
ncbi:hypothetical protein WR25_13308 [Diploscapter pachys]|uniref:Uncharacterized protein n=1 Tax=Diploscapter pachys TaxID=2018661 RepID=A0A2A2JY91_9BILA|nr:hypothetical protein WR25_13308 [Diploscapter pachys]